MLKKTGIVVVSGMLVILGIGCVSARLKAEVKALRAENEELQLTNQKLESDYLSLSRNNELLAGELRKSQEDEDDYAQPLARSQDSQLMRNLESKGLEVINRDGNPAIIATSIFNPGSATISTDGKAALNKIINAIKSEAPTIGIRVDGYTDNQPIKESKYKSNENLSLARADAVKDYFVDNKMSEKRISTRGLGSANPIADNKTTEGKQKNRRVEIVLLIQ